MDINRYPISKAVFSIFVFLAYLFLYLPIIILVIFSFNSASFPAPWSGFSLKWYYELFDSFEIWNALINSLIVSCSATLLSILLTLSLVFWSLTNSKTGKLIPFFYANVSVPEVVLSVGLLYLFSYLKISLGLLSLIIGHTVLGLGYSVPIIYSYFDSMDKEMIESSLDLGATVTQTFFKIILPVMKPAIIASSLLVFIISFDDFILSFFCSGSESQTLSLYIFSMIKSGLSPVVNALSTILLFFSSFFVLIFCSLNSKIRIF